MANNPSDEQAPDREGKPSSFSQWIQPQLNRIEKRLSDIERRLGRIEKLEGVILGVLGTIGVFWLLFQFVFSQFDITIKPKSPSVEAVKRP